MNSNKHQKLARVSFGTEFVKAGQAHDSRQRFFRNKWRLTHMPFERYPAPHPKPISITLIVQVRYVR